MPYSARLCETLTQDAVEVRKGLNQVLFDLALASEALVEKRSKEHLSQGAGRRVGVLAHCLSTIFEKFPPSTKTLLPQSTLYDVQIAHHAFVINLYGYFENLAWAFVLRHNIEKEVGGPRKIGLFLQSTRRLLPPRIKDYLTSATMVKWHDDYLKNYRDALAHRVPLYIPPATLTAEEVAEADTLSTLERAAILDHRWNDLDEIRDKQIALGQPCLFFAHSFSDHADPRPIYLHPQLLCDAKTVIEFTPHFLAAWHERA